jgi:hypothetical protein
MCGGPERQKWLQCAAAMAGMGGSVLAAGNRCLPGLRSPRRSRPSRHSDALSRGRDRARQGGQPAQVARRRTLWGQYPDEFYTRGGLSSSRLFLQDGTAGGRRATTTMEAQEPRADEKGSPSLPHDGLTAGRCPSPRVLGAPRVCLARSPLILRPSRHDRYKQMRPRPALEELPTRAPHCRLDGIRPPAVSS